MNFEEYGKYMQDNLGVLAFKEQINSLERTMKQYREMKTVVMSSQMDGDQKRDTITSIGRMESALTQNIQILKKIAD
jgi:F0F1-type ATP synthase delta subunit